MAFDWTRILKGQKDRETREDIDATVAEREEAPRDVPAKSSLEPPAAAVAAEAPPTAAHARLGSEGVSRLRGRYAEILARISEQVTDPVRREELKAHAERLNPDTWVTDGEVRIGLEQYEVVLASLRTVVGRRRKRRRRGRRADRAVPDIHSSSVGISGGQETVPLKPDATGEDVTGEDVTFEDAEPEEPDDSDV